MSARLPLALVLALSLYCFTPTLANENEVAWLPAHGANTTRPWTRWWWHGSAVDEANITRCLEQYAAAGLGGVEITCIYGVKGAEDRQLDYLSPEWRSAVSHAIREAQRLGLAVDLPPGSGWRMGGPQVEAHHGNMQLELTHHELVAGETLEQKVDRVPRAVIAHSATGEQVQLVTLLDAQNVLRWQAPLDQGTWKVYVLQEKYNREQVKRPAPGGEGLNINPFCPESVTAYLDQLGKQMADLPSMGIRASFHDSFEYGGNWSRNFLAEFHQRRGYRLEEHLPLLNGDGERDRVARLKSDYRETLSDLVLDHLISTWVAWSHERGLLTRNQAHGSPGNWLDLYAACDIPETETFGPLGKHDSNPLVLKFASSAAHVAGRPLVGCESATWLDEHFTVTLELLKERLDQQFLAGVNHVVYHGTAYSPDDAEWPGWVFYASTQLNPQNPIWRHFKQLNEYVTRCQSSLQSGTPGNEVLLYWPIHDTWHDARGLRREIRVHDCDKWLLDAPVGRVAQELSDLGMGFDYVSDRLLGDCRVGDGKIYAPGATYQALLVPPTEMMPAATLEKIIELANQGATVLFLESLPSSAPGLLHTESPTRFEAALATAETMLHSHENVAGRLLVGEQVEELLKTAVLSPEPFAANTPLKFIRREMDNGWCYFLKNDSDEEFDEMISLNVPWRIVALMDPSTGRSGGAATEGRQIRVQLAPGETVFLRTFDVVRSGNSWRYRQEQTTPIELKGPWSVEFVHGGPKLPDKLVTEKLEAWDQLIGADGERFSGTAVYALEFDAPAEGAGRYLLDLGQVAHSARVLLNGPEVGTLISSPYRVPIELSEGKNRLAVEVTSTAANRIRDLDRRGVSWRIFHDINFVNINYRPFDASEWHVSEAGLLGPVVLYKLE